MQSIARALTLLSDDQLAQEVQTLTMREREATAQVIAALAELDARKLYLAQGFSSLFTYCTDHLHLSEHEAYNRMKVARAVREWPIMLELLADGSLTVTAARLLAPHLTYANHETVLCAATHKKIREIEEQVAALRPIADVPSTLRKVPDARPAGVREPDPSRVKTDAVGIVATLPMTEAKSLPPVVFAAAASSNRPIVAPLAPERYRIQFTISRETRDKLRRVQDLLRHAVPDGDPAVVFDRALTSLLADLERKKLARSTRPRESRPGDPTRRYVAATVRREVWRRDGGRCAFVGTSGRCTERGFLEFHHVIPFAEGGKTSVENLELRCKPHNAYEADAHFGTLFVREVAFVPYAPVV